MSAIVFRDIEGDEIEMEIRAFADRPIEIHLEIPYAIAALTPDVAEQLGRGLMAYADVARSGGYTIHEDGHDDRCDDCSQYLCRHLFNPVECGSCDAVRRSQEPLGDWAQATLVDAVPGGAT